MKSQRAIQRLLHPAKGGKIAEAREYGIDLTQIAENLRMSPAERIRANDEAVNSVVGFEAAMRVAKAIRNRDE
ncbi:MAG: hypothetical protein ACK4S4_08400 [Pyrinomonadaceae bacterium]